jgi:hypothetical protein
MKLGGKRRGAGYRRYLQPFSDAAISVTHNQCSLRQVTRNSLRITLNERSELALDNAHLYYKTVFCYIDDNQHYSVKLTVQTIVISGTVQAEI